MANYWQASPAWHLRICRSYKVPAHSTAQEALAAGIPHEWWLLIQAADLAAGQHARCLAPPPARIKEVHVIRSAAVAAHSTQAAVLTAHLTFMRGSSERIPLVSLKRRMVNRRRNALASSRINCTRTIPAPVRSVARRVRNTGPPPPPPQRLQGSMMSLGPALGGD